MPADGIALPIKEDFGTSRGQLLRQGYMRCARAKKASTDVLSVAWRGFVI
jgi:hypothetical protein